MKIIFGTTNKRKVSDLMGVIKELNLDIEVLSLSDINWNLGEIEETGQTIEENSLIKAKAIYDFCLEKNINYPIITDDAGLFVHHLNGEPGVYTARYADKELADNKELPKYYGVIKLLNKLNGIENRDAIYQCCVTCMMPDGTYFQEIGESKGRIVEEIIGELTRPYFYSVFLVNEFSKVINELNSNELQQTFRFKALKKVFTKLCS